MSDAEDAVAEEELPHGANGSKDEVVITHSVALSFDGCKPVAIPPSLLVKDLWWFKAVWCLWVVIALQISQWLLKCLFHPGGLEWQ